MSLFGDFEHHLHISVGYYIPNSRVMFNWDIYQPLLIYKDPAPAIGSVKPILELVSAPARCHMSEKPSQSIFFNHLQRMPSRVSRVHRLVVVFFYVFQHDILVIQKSAFLPVVW